jgi:cytochrome bd ubiquinol oxidase subunit I
MDVVTLSRIQFSLHTCFHYIYPPLSIGLGMMLVIFEGIYMKTKNPIHKELVKFWVKIFALTFVLGVATGLVQIFGFGTNWARYSRFVGDVFGSALGAEGIFAFFLEAGFLGVMLFGWDRVRPTMHYVSTILVSVGAHFSAVWIVIANSWMQTPAGYKIVGEGPDRKAIVTDFWQMLFNPSSLDRIFHVLVGAWLAGIFLVLSICAYYLLRNRHLEFARLSMKIALVAGVATVILQLISADLSARLVARYQPAKLAAMEGIFVTEPKSPMAIIGWVDKKEERVNGILVPGLLSFLTYRDVDMPVTGLNAFPKEDWPHVQAVFQMYHLMIYMWGAMTLLVFLGIFFWWRKTLENKKWFLWCLIFSVFLPQVANQAGWFTAEMGRQPWVVYNLLRTKDGISTNINSAQVAGSITMFTIIFILLFILFLFLLNYKIKHGPDEPGAVRPDSESLYVDRLR